MANYLRASDLCIGWAFPRADNSRAVVCVLPKPWHPRFGDGTRKGRLVDLTTMLGRSREVGDGRYLYYCYQGEVLCDSWSAPPVPDPEGEKRVRALFEQLHEYATATPKPRKRKPYEDEAWGDEDDEDDDEEALLATRRLFASSHKPKQGKVNEKADGQERRELTGPQLQAALIRLLIRARPREWLDALTFQTDPIFREAIARHYVTELAKVAERMRRGYLERRERLQSPRGRVVASSAGRSEATGEPSIVCDYNDFERDLPLHRVLASALLVSIAVLSHDTDDEDDVRTTAYRLRHALEGILPYPTVQARVTAERLRLSPAQVPLWQGPLTLARAVLSEYSPLEATDSPDPTPDLTIPSASLWERILSGTLKAGGFGLVGESAGSYDHGEGNEDDKSIAPPWELPRAGSFRCDIVVRHPADHFLILDAKYAALVPVKQGTVEVKDVIIPVAHTRQLFAYATLWKAQKCVLTKKDWKVNAGLVYLQATPPTADQSGAGGPTWLIASVQNRLPARGKDYPYLFVLSMHFPSPTSCGSAAALDAFDVAAGDGWKALLNKETAIG